MTITAMKQALEHLGWVMSHGPAVQMAKDVLQQAIEQAEQAQEPAVCTHGWFQTGAMEPGQMRCIHCGEWGQRTAHGIKEKNT